MRRNTAPSRGGGKRTGSWGGCNNVSNDQSRDHNRGKHRNRVVAQVFSQLLRSRVAHVIWTFLLSLALTLLLPFQTYLPLLPLPLLVLVVPASLAWMQRTVLRYELKLIREQVLSAVGSLSRWSLVDDNLYLGCAPLMEAGDCTLLVKKLGVCAVLSFCDPAVAGVSTAVGTAVSADDWRVFDLKYKTVAVSEADATLSQTQLRMSSDHINVLLSNGERVYVHCTTGRGLSAQAVMAYFIQYRNCTAAQAYRQLNTKRLIGFRGTGTGAEMESLVQFERSMRGGSSHS